MQDRFRFRVWCNRKKCYLYNAEMNNAIVLSQLPDYKIAEQCTGLKDKDGKLIYEGDIIFDGYCKRTIKWHGWYWVAESYSESCPLYRFILKESNIIGNIHENADLLENK